MLFINCKVLLAALLYRRDNRKDVQTKKNLPVFRRKNCLCPVSLCANRIILLLVYFFHNWSSNLQRNLKEQLKRKIALQNNIFSKI